MPIYKPAAICPHCRKAVKALPLNHRQLEVLQGILAQKTSREIAHALCIGLKTVESYRQQLFVITGVDNVVGLVKWSLEAGFSFVEVERQPGR